MNSWQPGRKDDEVDLNNNSQVRDTMEGRNSKFECRKPNTNNNNYHASENNKYNRKFGSNAQNQKTTFRNKNSYKNPNRKLNTFNNNSNRSNNCVHKLRPVSITIDKKETTKHGFVVRWKVDQSDNMFEDGIFFQGFIEVISNCNKLNSSHSPHKFTETQRHFEYRAPMELDLTRKFVFRITIIADHASDNIQPSVPAQREFTRDPNYSKRRSNNYNMCNYNSHKTKSKLYCVKNIRYSHIKADSFKVEFDPNPKNMRYESYFEYEISVVDFSRKPRTFVRNVPFWYCKCNPYVETMFKVSVRVVPTRDRLDLMPSAFVEGNIVTSPKDCNSDHNKPRRLNICNINSNNSNFSIDSKMKDNQLHPVHNIRYSNIRADSFMIEFDHNPKNRKYKSDLKYVISVKNFSVKDNKAKTFAVKQPFFLYKCNEMFETKYKVCVKVVATAAGLQDSRYVEGACVTSPKAVQCLEAVLCLQVKRDEDTPDTVKITWKANRKNIKFEFKYKIKIEDRNDKNKKKESFFQKKGITYWKYTNKSEWETTYRISVLVVSKNPEIIQHSQSTSINFAFPRISRN